MVGSSSATVTGLCTVVLLACGLRLLVVAGSRVTLVALGLTATVATAAVAPALADLTGLPLPDRTTGSGSTATARGSSSGRSATASLPGRSMVVHTGDSLWGISARLLARGGRGASDALVTRTWHRLHRANRARIGPDPDLILPGTRLALPAAAAARARDAS